MGLIKSEELKVIHALLENEAKMINVLIRKIKNS
jgi:hypothetical protein